MNIAEYSVNNCDNTAEFIKLMGKYEQLVIWFYLFFILASILKISKYNQINVTKRPKAPYHSINLGAPFSEPSSIKSKSITKFSDAITTINRETPILKFDELFTSRNEIPDPKMLIIKSTTYKRKIPPVAAKRPNLKFSSGLIILERYANKGK